MNKYSIETKTIDNIIGFIKNKSIVIPEMQRPFVWKNTQVRDLIDSLYEEYPVGYLVVWQNPSVRDKNTGEISKGKQIIIDGQQRVTALIAAICGERVLDDDFQEKEIKIAYNPFPQKGEKRFEVLTAAIKNNKRWVPNIADLFQPGFDQWTFVENFSKDNPEHPKNEINKAIQSLIDIKNRQIGFILLDEDLGIDVVTEIFIRINSKGTSLEQADFVMSTLAADEKYGGNLLRKSIDYFCHLVSNSSSLSQIEKDTHFRTSEYYDIVKWAADGSVSIFTPSFDDIIRVAFLSKYDRGRLANLVELLHGRNYQTQSYEESIMGDTFKTFSAGVRSVQNKYLFMQFQEAMKGAGFIREDMNKNRHMAMDFSYALFLRLHETPDIKKTDIAHYMCKWFAMSLLTGRYTGSPESAMDKDLRSIRDKGFLSFLEENLANLSDSFWTITIPQALESSASTTPVYQCYLAAQCKASDDAFLYSGGKVRDLMESGDEHHLFPKEYLKKAGINDKKDYNQIANYAYLNTPVNIAIGRKAPNVYMREIINSLRSGQLSLYTNIQTEEELRANMKTNCIPIEFIEMDYTSYKAFLAQRRQLMADKIRIWFESL